MASATMCILELILEINIDNSVYCLKNSSEIPYITVASVVMSTNLTLQACPHMV